MMSRKINSFFSSSKILILAFGIAIGSLSVLFLDPKHGFNTSDAKNFGTNNKRSLTMNFDVEMKRNQTNVAVKESPSPNSNSNWCPRANCTNTDLCHPCQRRFLIVIATARSASTTLTWMLNELPGVRMSGENNNHLDSIWKTKSNLWDNNGFEYGIDRKNAWGRNPLPPQYFACAAQATMEAIVPPRFKDGKFVEDPQREQDEIIGFKTIRFDRGAEGNIEEMVNLVKEIFPCSRILININSNVKRQVKSSEAVNIPASENYLVKRNEKFHQMQKMFGDDQAYLLDSAIWTQNTEHLNDAIEWLGFHKSCRFNELLKFNTDGGGFGNAKEKLEHRDANCQELES